MEFTGIIHMEEDIYMMDINIDSEYSYLLSNKENNVLVKVIDGYCICDIINKNALIIEDDELYLEVIDAMIKNGNEIYDSINDIENSV